MACGFLNIDKPAGLTSRRVVDVVASRVRPARAGHAGTLDPLATGVLVVAVGRATRLIARVQAGTKDYRARFLLGQTSDTDDVTGEVQVAEPAPALSLEQINEALGGFLGRIEQVPPRYSAVKIAGRRAYDLARSGEVPTLTPRMVEVHSIQLAAWNSPALELEITCGSGTYIRSIGRDLGQRLGCGAVMSELVRTRVGPFGIGEALSLEDVKGLDEHGVAARLLPPVIAVADLPRQECTDEETREIVHGRRIACRVDPPDDRGSVALLDATGQLLAVAEFRAESNQLAPRHVFAM